MATDNPTIKRLRELRTLVKKGGLTQDQLKPLRVEDVDGRVVRLDDAEAIHVLDRRIAAAEAKGIA